MNLTRTIAPTLKLSTPTKTRLGRTYSVALTGMEGRIVEIEADIGSTLPGFTLLGLPDQSLNEAKDRIRAAARNSGQEITRRHLTVNLTPASLHKHGSVFDLAIVMAAYGADCKIQNETGPVFLSTLGLDGSLQHSPGILPAVQAAVEAGLTNIIVSADSVDEARLVPGANVQGYHHLSEVLRAFGAKVQLKHIDRNQPQIAAAFPANDDAGDLSDIAGQEEAKWALEVAAAGNHHVLMAGPPGVGKTMLASRLATILPELDTQTSLEATAIRSLSNRSSKVTQLLSRPPFQSPHHSTTVAALLGGTVGYLRPGAVTLAHGGILFLDEAPEFDRKCLEVLRQPLESGYVDLHRAKHKFRLPARFQLIMAANPCPCGWGYGNATRCTCTSLQRRRYAEKLSGPLLDRTDVQISLAPLKSTDFQASTPTETSATVRKRVEAARQRQTKRLSPFGLSLNSEVPAHLLEHPDLAIEKASMKILHEALDSNLLTARGYVRAQRVAWTLADLNGHDKPQPADIHLALHLRLRQQVNHGN